MLDVRSLAKDAPDIQSLIDAELEAALTQQEPDKGGEE